MILKKSLIFNTAFDTYEATEIIGEGGAGRIYLVKDSSGNKLALKYLVPKKSTTIKIKRFKNEISFCERNKHKNIVTILDHGIYYENDNHSPFYVMPLFDGSLRDLLKSALEPEKALEYFSQIMDGIEAAHMQEVFHRDLKPENILYEKSVNRLLIADFGIAHFSREDLLTAVETNFAERLANFQYAAPEQRIRGTTVDHRCDIYSLGLILNELFTRIIPIGSGYKKIMDVSTEYSYLDELVEHMIRQNPEDRPISIEIIKHELIGRGKQFITEQRISELKETVIPVSEIDDPLVSDPVRIVDFDWDGNVLTLIFQQPVTSEWVESLKNIGNYAFLMGKEPGNFHFQGDKASIRANEGQVQSIINHFKSWLPLATKAYERRLVQKLEKKERVEREKLRKLTEIEEARKRVQNNVKI